MWIRELGIRYKLGDRRAEPVARSLLTTVLFLASAVWASFAEWERPGLFFFHFGLAETRACSARSWRRTSRCSSLFFDLMLVPFYFLTGSGAGRGACRRR